MPPVLFHNMPTNEILCGRKYAWSTSGYGCCECWDLTITVKVIFMGDLCNKAWRYQHHVWHCGNVRIKIMIYNSIDVEFGFHL